MTKPILVSLYFVGKLMRFSFEYKTRNMPKKNINKILHIKDLENLKY